MAPRAPGTLSPITQTKASWIHEHTISHQHEYLLIIPFKFLFVSPIAMMTFEAATPCKLACMPLACIAVVLWGAVMEIWKRDEAHCYQELFQQIKIKAKPDWMGCERLHEVMFFFEIPHFSNIGNCLSKQFKLAKTFCLPTQPPEVNMHKAPSLNLI